MWEEYAKKIGSTRDALTEQQKIQAEVNGIMKETEFQVGNAAKYTSTYQGKVAAFNQVLFRLQVSWGQAFAKIGEIVLPALTNLAIAMTNVGNLFSQFVNTLLGVKNQQNNVANSASNATKAQEDLAGAISDTNKKAKGSVAGFDEVNSLTEQIAANATNAAGATSDMTLNAPGVNNEIETPKPDEGTMKFVENLRMKFADLSNYWNLFVKNFNDAMKQFIPIMKPVVEFFGNAFFRGIEVILKDILFLFSMFFKGLEVVFGGWKKLIDADWVQIWNNIKTFTQQTLAGIGQFFVNAFTWIGNVVRNGFTAIGKFIVDVWSELSKFMQQTLAGIGQFFVNAWNWIGSTTNTAFTSISTFFKNIWNGVSSFISPILTSIGSAFSKTWNSVADGTKKIWTGIVDFMKGAINSIIGFINGLIDAWNKLKFEMPKFEYDWFGSKQTVGGWTFQVPQIPTIPKLADGGIVNGATTFMAGEAGAEAIVPLENSAFIKKFAQMVADNNGSKTVETSIYIDGVKFARAITPAIKKESSRIGNTSIITI